MEFSASPRRSADETVPDNNSLPPSDPTPPIAPRLSFQHYEGPRSHIAWARTRSSGHAHQRKPSPVLQHPSAGRRWWKFTLREWDDEDDQDWWFASTAIPLLAATIGPLANVMSIAALVTYWRMCLVRGATKDSAAQCLWDGDSNSLVEQLSGQTYHDPEWCYDLNLASLIVGFIGNFFLLCNFTNRIRYIIALPATIVAWYVATGILIAITSSMEVYVAPTRPQQKYTQGFWYAVIAACMYMICSMLLMVNMLGYFLGHYPQRFTLTESQRTLILQTMLYFIWLAGGGAVFSRVETLYGTEGENWSFVNALYFCDVTILTVGFGDLYPTSNVGRGLVLPYSVGGIIMLGLVVSSITKFTADIGSENVIRQRIERNRTRTISRTVTSSSELERRRPVEAEGQRPPISAPINSVDLSAAPNRAATDIADDEDNWEEPGRANTRFAAFLRAASFATQPITRMRQPKLILLREEKDRFDAMRTIQHDTAQFKRWSALFMSVSAFGILWCAGAVVFWLCERHVQGMTYFQALYFCYVSLITVGYGDLAPRSNPGRPFFVFWSLIAVPTMTILIGNLGETVITKFKKSIFRLADFTVLPQRGVWREFLERYPWLLHWLQQRKARRDAKKRLEAGFPLGPDPATEDKQPTIDQLAQDEPSTDELARRLPNAIKKTAEDVRSNSGKRYSYEEWVEFTQLIRFSASKEEDRGADDEEDEGLVDWDWIGEDSPMMSKGSEAEFVLERLCESLNRYIKQVTRRTPNSNGQHTQASGRMRDAGEDNGLRNRSSGESAEPENTGFHNGRASEPGTLSRMGSSSPSLNKAGKDSTES